MMAEILDIDCESTEDNQCQENILVFMIPFVKMSYQVFKKQMKNADWIM